MSAEQLVALYKCTECGAKCARVRVGRDVELLHDGPCRDERSRLRALDVLLGAVDPARGAA